MFFASVALAACATGFCRAVAGHAASSGAESDCRDVDEAEPPRVNHLRGGSAGARAPQLNRVVVISERKCVFRPDG